MYEEESRFSSESGEGWRPLSKSEAGAMQGDAHAHDDCDDDDDEVSEESQRHAALRVRAFTEIQRAYRAGDWRAAQWFLQRGEDGLLGPFCRACSPTCAPEVVRNPTPAARAAAKFLDDDDRKSWGPNCRSCGALV